MISFPEYLQCQKPRVHAVYVDEFISEKDYFVVKLYTTNIEMNDQIHYLCHLIIRKKTIQIHYRILTVNENKTIDCSFLQRKTICLVPQMIAASCYQMQSMYSYQEKIDLILYVEIKTLSCYFARLLNI